MDDDSFKKRLKILVDKFGEGHYSTFAKKAGLPPSTVQNYIEGRYPKVEQLLKIQSIYGINIHWLLTGEGPLHIKPLEHSQNNNSKECPKISEGSLNIKNHGDSDKFEIISLISKTWSVMNPDERGWLKIEIKNLLNRFLEISKNK